VCPWSIQAGRRRFVFSSSTDPIRSAGTREAAKESSLVSWVGVVAESLFATLFPADCRLCGVPLVSISRLPVCQDCLSAVRPITGGVCSICGERLLSPFAVSDAYGEPKCGLCRRMGPPFARAVAYGSYEGGLRELIHLLKYEQVRPAANVLGRMLAEAVAGLGLFLGEQEIPVVPVPLYSAKLRQRGFNQSETIARVALKLDPCHAKLVLKSGLLERARATQSQIGLTRHQRRENLRGAFAVTKPEDVLGREVLLVDDVFTTGTTVSECARVLRRAGASKVWVATVARTLKHEATFAELEVRSEAGLAVAAAG
jgi:ComF family protein